MDSKRDISLGTFLAYGIGGLAINTVVIADQFGMYFLTDIALLPARAVGIINLITTLFDAVNDPIIGHLADQSNTRWGKYRPF